MSDLDNLIAAVNTLEELAEGLRISIEAEEAVVAALQKYEPGWEAARLAQEVPVGLTRRIRQSFESKGQIRRWRRELSAYEAAIGALATPAALAASPEVAALIREAEARGMERAMPTDQAIHDLADHMWRVHPRELDEGGYVSKRFGGKYENPLAAWYADQIKALCRGASTRAAQPPATHTGE